MAADLAAAGVDVRLLKYKYDFWDGRKSIVVSLERPLIPGYLLVGQDYLPVSATRRWCQFLADHTTGAPLRVHDADGLLERCGRGEFNVSHKAPFYPDGSSVRVLLLGVAGRVLRRVRRDYRVMLSTGREITVGQQGLSLA